MTEHLMGDAKAASRELRDWLKAEGVQTPTAQVVRKPIVDEVKDVASARVSNKKLWDESFPLTEDCPPMKYLRARGITMPLSQFPSANVMRWHPNAVYRKEKDEEGHTYSRFPALISKVVRNGKTVALHRIYVTKDGLAKADVKRPKKLTAASSTHISGCAIPLYTPKNGILGVCEGVETGLAIRQLFGHSIWPCISDSFMAAVEWDLVIEAVSASGAAVKELHVFVDLDRNKAGQKAGDKLKERGKAAGVKVIIHLPKGTIPADAKGIDFLDNLVSPTK